MENLKQLLTQKEILILYGNVRDTTYIKKNGDLVKGLTELIWEIGKEFGYDEERFWGVFYNNENKSQSPMWAIERIDIFNEEGGKSEVEEINVQDKEVVLLTKWLQKYIMDINKKRIFVIYYIDKLTPYNPRGPYPKDKEILITLIQKIIENISSNNRLIMVSLQDTMIPFDYYTNSPKVAVMEIPKPGKEERKIYFSKHLIDFNQEHLDFLANITDGLYVRDIDNILRDVLSQKKDISNSILRKIVNRYRIGTEEDPWENLPLSGSPKGLIDSAENWFKEKVIAQDYAVEEVVKAIKKARAGVVGLASGQLTKPKAVFFFAGPTGVGKTFLAKKLAEYLFDSESAFVRMDMSEYKEEHTVSKLIGSPPGYVGYEEGGQLTKSVKSKPFSVILFDEIEKAHPKIMDIFLQILDDGRLTDSRGQIVFFTECVIIFTSNIGARTTNNRGNPISERENLEKILSNKEISEEQKQEMVREHFVEAVREFFMYEISRPELLNRIGSHIIPFNYISIPESQRKIIKSKLEDIKNNFQDKFFYAGHILEFKEDVSNYFFNKHRENIEKFGGRGLVNIIEDEIGPLLAEQLLFAEKTGIIKVKFTFFVSENGELKCRRE